MQQGLAPVLILSMELEVGGLQTEPRVSRMEVPQKVLVWGGAGGARPGLPIHPSLRGAWISLHRTEPHPTPRGRQAIDSVLEMLWAEEARLAI